MEELIKQLSEMNEHLTNMEKYLSNLEGINVWTSGIDDNLENLASCIVNVRGSGPELRICGDVVASVTNY